MPPYFDGTDLGDPDAMAANGYLSGLASGFSAGAMPSRAPIPFGATLGAAAAQAQQGSIAGAKAGQELQAGQMANETGSLNLDQAFLTENMLRHALNLPLLKSKSDLLKSGNPTSSPLFGNALAQPSGTPQQAATGADNTPAAAGPVSGGQSVNAPGTNDELGNIIVQSRLGIGLTDYQKAKAAEALALPGADKDEAAFAASKAAGITPDFDLRGGAEHQVVLPGQFNADGSPKYKIVGKNPILSPDLQYDQDKGVASVVPGALEGVGQLKSVEQGAIGYREKNVDSFNNFLATGGLGIGTSTGDIKAPVVPPDYVAKVGALESSNNPDAQNPQAGQTSAGQDGFNNATWLDQAKQHLPTAMTEGRTDQQIIAMRSDPQISGYLTAQYANDNAQAMQAAGIKNIGPGELYLSHHFGADGAAAIMKASANTPIEQVLPASVIKANPELAGQTVADVYSSARQTMKGVGAQQNQATSAPQPPKTGQPTKTAAGTVIPPVSQAAPINPAGDYLAKRLPQWADQEDDWNESLQSGYIAEQRALAISDALKVTQSGQWATEKADIAAKLKSVGINVPNNVLGDPAAVQEVLKNAFQATLGAIGSFTKRPAAVEVKLYSQNFANPDLQPAAVQQIIGETVGTLRWERGLINDWATGKQQGWQDPQDFQRVWSKQPENSLQGFINKTEQEIGPLKGMPGGPGQPMSLANKIAYTAKKHGLTEDQVRAQMKASGQPVN